LAYTVHRKRWQRPERFFHLTGHGCGEPHRTKSENDDGHVTALD
jgi:hypothetical protein